MWLWFRIWDKAHILEQNSRDKMLNNLVKSRSRSKVRICIDEKCPKPLWKRHFSGEWIILTLTLLKKRENLHIFGSYSKFSIMIMFWKCQYISFKPRYSHQCKNFEQNIAQFIHTERGGSSVKAFQLCHSTICKYVFDLILSNFGFI